MTASLTCPLQHKAVIHPPCKINILWQRIDNNFFHFREFWNIIQVPIHNFVATNPISEDLFQVLYAYNGKHPWNRMHVTALLYKDMMSTPPFQTPAVSVYLLDHLHVSLKQNPFYKKSRRGFCHECNECKNSLGSRKIVKLRKQLPFLCNGVHYHTKTENLFKIVE